MPSLPHKNMILGIPGSKRGATVEFVSCEHSSSPADAGVVAPPSSENPESPESRSESLLGPGMVTKTDFFPLLFHNLVEPREEASPDSVSLKGQRQGPRNYPKYIQCQTQAA